MNWHNDALRPSHDAKEMSPHLQPTDRPSTDEFCTVSFVTILAHKQIVVLDQVMLEIIRYLHSNPVQGHPGSKKILYELRKRYYSPSLAEKTQKIL